MTRATATALAAALALGGAACDPAIRPIEPTAQSANDCSRCHGYPPPAFIAGGTSHTTDTQCSACHPGTVEADNATIVPGGLHMNGVVDVAGGAGHGLPFLADHPAAAMASLGSCTGCHGADYGGGAGPSCNACHGTLGYADWKTNCTFCHGTRTQGFAGAPVWLPAPPQTIAGTGDQSTSSPKVGAHQKHVGNGSTLSNGVACTECHPAATSLAHVGGSGTAQLAWGPLATNGGAAASMSSGTCANYCHGATLPGTGRARPAWAPPTAMSCGSCHEANPTTGEHPSRNSSHSGFGCDVCHGAGFVAGSSVNKAVHVDGAIYKVPGLNWQGPPQYTTKSCDPSCHGRENW